MVVGWGGVRPKDPKWADFKEIAENREKRADF